MSSHYTKVALGLSVENARPVLTYTETADIAILHDQQDLYKMFMERAKARFSTEPRGRRRGH